MSTTASPSLDHLRMLTAVVDSGSFSAAARQLDRSQPAVSYAIAALEAQLKLTLFERGRRKPILTQSGIAVLAYARRICQLADDLAANAASLTGGLEGALSFAVDSFFPKAALSRALTELALTFPSIGIDVRVLSREQALREVTEGRALFAISAIDVAWPSGIEARDFGIVEIVAVAAPTHELAQHPDRVPTMLLRDCVQITNRAAGIGDEALDVSVNSSRLWRVNDTQTQLLLLRAGVGWAYLPWHLAQPEIAAATLVQLNPASRQRGTQPWSLIYRAAHPPGPASRFLCERIERYATNQDS